MTDYDPALPIVYVEDGPVQVALYKLKLNWFLDVVGAWLLHREAKRQIAKTKPWIVHFTSPISPSVPHFPLTGAPIVIGPLNGNLLHPPALLYRESKSKLLGAKLLRPTQWLSRLLFRGKHKARIFISGGERTVKALELGGCKRSQMVFTLDSGVDAELREAPRLTHEGANWRFVLAGRLGRYKGCDLVIRALKAVPQAHLDVIGDGAERANLEALAHSEGVADRVHFLGFMPGGSILFEKLRSYRAFVFPTLAEANGIVIQEAMMMGLPVVSVNWGGPAELLDGSTAILIEPESENAIVQGLSVAMTKLATQPDVAEALSHAARTKAEIEGYDWPSLLRNWISLYDDVLAERGEPRRFGAWRKGAAQADMDQAGKA